MNPSSMLYVLSGIVINIFTSVVLIPVNKYIYTKIGFPNMTLTCLHFIVTFLGLLVCNLFKIVTIKRVSVLKMLPMAFTFCGFVVLTNISLQYNTIGTYQCLKALTTPGVMVISFYYYKTSYSARVIISVLPVLLGIYVNSMFDMKFSPTGITFGLVSAAITSLYQVFVGEKQKEFNLNSLQLLFYQAPLSALILIFIVPLAEPIYNENGMIFTSLTLFEWFVVLSSSVLAFGVNLSIYWIIGSTSALTYNMVGYLKFILIIGSGILFFDEQLNIQQMVAFMFILSGLIAYTTFRMQETDAEKAAKAKYAAMQEQNRAADSSIDLAAHKESNESSKP